MRALKLFTHSEGSLIGDYAHRMSDALRRRRAEMEVRAARAEAEVAIKSRSEFLANMNHELRTPLNAIIGFATMLRDGADYSLDEEQKRTYAEYILQSADLLLGHINTILEVAALESGSVEIVGENVDLGEAMDRAIERVGVRAGADGVTIKSRDDGAGVFGWGDSERTGQAIDHLLQTAVKACGEGGRILVRTRLDERGWPEIAVRDNGAGLSDEELNEALEAFTEMHRGLDRSFSGPGIGYAVAKTFVEMQGGRFTIKSRKGQGTLVRIALPPSEHIASPQTAEAQEERNDFIVEKAHDAA